MRSLINLIILALLIFGVYSLAKNPTIQQYVKGYTAQTKSEVSDLAHGTPVSFNLQSISNSFSNIMNMGMYGSDTTIPAVVTPGPLTKIPTDTSTAGTSATKSSGTSASTQTTSIPAGTGTLLDSKGIIADTNQQRALNGVASVTESNQLDASALVKAKDILAREYFEHTAPDGKTVSDLVGEQGYTYIKIGENLALGDFTSDQDVVTAWMNSPGHRANILDPEFQQMGVGVAYGVYQGQYVYVAVQHFGKPTSACPTIDQNLKDEVTAGQAKLTADANALQTQKAAIDQGTAAGTDESAQIAAYNAGVESYQAEYATVDAERVQYNAQVTAFNACLSPTS